MVTLILDNNPSLSILIKSRLNSKKKNNQLTKKKKNKNFLRLLVFNEIKFFFCYKNRR